MPRERRSKYGNDAKDNASLASQLAQKANQADIENKADKEYVDSQILTVNTGGTIDLSYKADVTYVQEKTKPFKEIKLPDKNDNTQLFAESRVLGNWSFTSGAGSTATITEVETVDKSAFPTDKFIPDSLLNPWKYQKDHLWNDLGNTVIKCTMQGGGSGIFHFGLSQPTYLNGTDGELMVLIWIDRLSLNTSGSMDLEYYTAYPDTSVARRGLISINQTNSYWTPLLLPYTIDSTVTFPKWAGGASGTIQANGVGLSVKSSTGNFTFYIGGVFKVKNPLKNKKGVLMIDFDDGFKSQYTQAFQYMKGKYNYNASIGIVGSWVESGDPKYVTKWEMTEMERNGWDMISHTWEHQRADVNTLAQQHTALQKNYDWLGVHGCERGRRFLCHPNNIITHEGIYAASQFHKIVRGSSTASGQLPDSIWQHNFPSQDWGGNWTEASWRTLLKFIQDNKVIRHIHAHGIGDGEGSFNPFTIEQFQLFIDIIQEYDIEVKTYSELWDETIVPNA